MWLWNEFTLSHMYYYYTHLTTCFPGQVGTRKVKPVWIEMRQEMMGLWKAVASAGPYANNLHLAPDR